MRQSRLAGAVMTFLAACTGGNSLTNPSATIQPMFVIQGGFDELGYNRTARNFNGAADGVDGTIDGTYWGDPTFAADNLVMRWNSEWDRGNSEGWSDPDGYRAWINNEWNGQVPGGSGETWHYMIQWVGSCGPTGTVLPDGGYCIWGVFEVILSQGTVANQHLWDALAVPAGFGI